MRVLTFSPERSAEMLAVDESLERFAKLDERQARVVEPSSDETRGAATVPFLFAVTEIVITKHVSSYRQT
jgi:hypothetical protein